jgi:hypothetical protein
MRRRTSNPLWQQRGLKLRRQKRSRNLKADVKNCAAGISVRKKNAAAFQTGGLTPN